MSRLLSWVTTKAVAIVEGDQEARIRAAALRLEKMIAERRSHFRLNEALASLQLFRDDIPKILEETYAMLVDRAWRDGEITSSERKTLDWVAGLLQLSNQQAKAIERHRGAAQFRNLLVSAVSQGVPQATEVDRLQRMASALGTNIRQLMDAYFRDEADGLLRGLFTSVVQTGSLPEEEWRRFLQVTAGLGFSEQEVVAAIRIQAERYIEHLLADAKSDETITDEERGTLSRLMKSLAIRPEFRQYVEQEIARIDFYTSLAKGRLPSLAAVSTNLRSGEIAHFDAPAAYIRVKSLKSGPRSERHDGQLTITDCRLIFISATLGIELNHRRVAQINEFNTYFELLSTGKGSGGYYLHDARLGTSILRAAVAKANQTLVEQDSDARNRHISRDVRQRVWQKYGGRCVDCDSDQYLEFDHIIPVAKGGSNSDGNVQLLCRRCNLKKSDAIGVCFRGPQAQRCDRSRDRLAAAIKTAMHSWKRDATLRQCSADSLSPLLRFCLANNSSLNPLPTRILKFKPGRPAYPNRPAWRFCRMGRR